MRITVPQHGGSGAGYFRMGVGGTVFRLWDVLRRRKKVSPYLTAGYGEKVKAYLRAGARALRGEDYYPNSRVGWGGLCVSESLPL